MSGASISLGGFSDPVIAGRGGVKPNNYSKPGPMGNTQGIIVPKTTIGKGNSAPAPKPVEKSWWSSLMTGNAKSPTIAF